MVALLIEETKNQTELQDQSKSNFSFWREAKTRVPGEKTSQSLVARDLTNSTLVRRRGRSRTQATMVEGECS